VIRTSQPVAAESREALERLVDEQAALRRVAILVAQGVRPDEIFAAVSNEVGRLVGTGSATVIKYDDDGEGISYVGSASKVSGAFPLGVHWKFQEGMASFDVYRTGRSARSGAHLTTVEGPIGDTHRQMGIVSAVASPIVVDGRLWGAMAVHGQEPLPPDTEERLEKFTELVATAIANVESRAALTRLADEQAALRRVALLVAQGVRPDEIFAAVSNEVGRLVGTDSATVVKFDDGGAGISHVGVASKMSEAFPLGAHWNFTDGMASAEVYRTGRSARGGARDWSQVEGPVAETHNRLGIVSTVASPIVVEGRLWGAVAVQSQEPLPLDIEERLEKFTELVATAIANAESRAELARLAGEQAALRRVATLVAKESSPAEVFATVAEEVASALGDVDCALLRDEGDRTGSAVASWGARASAVFPVGARIPLDGDGVVASVVREGRPYRLDDYAGTTGTLSERAREIGVRSAVGCPIVVGRRIWGAMAVANYAAEPFPAETESRIAQFSELVATAIANADARAEVERLAEEQAALRRVAMLVAGGASPTAVFDAVAAEMEKLLDADRVALSRYEPYAEVTVVAHRGSEAWRLPPGSRVSDEDGTVSSLVRRTERPARIEQFEPMDSASPELAHVFGAGAAVGAPIVVDGRLWGVIAATWDREKSPPADTEKRIAQFAQLLDTAIANADSRDQLDASRARLITEGDEARRRVVRDLHDGAQQRLVHAIIMLKLAQRALRKNDGQVESLLGEALEHAQRGNAELRELAHGILPAALTRGGLRAAVRAMVHRLDLPVEVHVPGEQFAAETESSAYFIVAEAITNVVKHAHAKRAEVRASVEDGMLHVEVRDDGVGGADPGGHGLVGIGDRVTALGGRLEIESPPGGGTLLAAALPLTAG
jgi:signal transduction histidine kinase